MHIKPINYDILFCLGTHKFMRQMKINRRGATLGQQSICSVCPRSHVQVPSSIFGSKVAGDGRTLPETLGNHSQSIARPGLDGIAWQFTEGVVVVSCDFRGGIM